MIRVGPFIAQQLTGVEPALERLFEALEREGRAVAQVIEIGTFRGAFTYLLATHKALANADKCSYDVVRTTDVAENLSLFEHTRTTLRLVDVWSPAVMEEIREIIQRPGLTIVFCDGGNKPREFNVLAHFLKQHDIIMAHDYARNREYASQAMDYRPEIVDLDVEQTCIDHSLFPFLANEFAAALWLSRRKLPPRGIDPRYENDPRWIDSGEILDGWLPMPEVPKAESVPGLAERPSHMVARSGITPREGLNAWTLSTFVPLSGSVLSNMMAKRSISEDQGKRIHASVYVEEIQEGSVDVRMSFFSDGRLVHQHRLGSYTAPTGEWISVGCTLDDIAFPTEANTYVLLVGIRRSQGAKVKGTCHFTDVEISPLNA